MAAAIAALDTDHIALRLPRNRAEWRLSQGVQFVVNGLMVLSLNAYLGKLATSPGSEDTMSLQYAWGGVFGLFMVINAVRFLNVPERIRPGGLAASSSSARSTTTHSPPSSTGQSPPTPRSKAPPSAPRRGVR